MDNRRAVGHRRRTAHGGTRRRVCQQRPGFGRRIRQFLFRGPKSECSAYPLPCPMGASAGASWGRWWGGGEGGIPLAVWRLGRGRTPWDGVSPLAPPPPFGRVEHVVKRGQIPPVLRRLGGKRGAGKLGTRYRPGISNSQTVRFCKGFWGAKQRCPLRRTKRRKSSVKTAKSGGTPAKAIHKNIHHQVRTPAQQSKKVCRTLHFSTSIPRPPVAWCTN